MGDDVYIPPPVLWLMFSCIAAIPIALLWRNDWCWGLAVLLCWLALGLLSIEEDRRCR